MKKEQPHSDSYYTTVNGKDYKLCVKGKIYFFIPSQQELPDGARQASFPEGHELYKDNNLPNLRKKTSRS